MNVINLFSLHGRTALITGGTRGIGLMIARGYIAQGARVYISSRKAEVGESVAKELGPNCVSLPADVSTIDGCIDLMGRYAEREKALDILVNNAGATWGAPLDDFPENGWDKVLDLNLKSPFFLTQKALPLLRQSGAAGRPAKVINIASIDGLQVNAWETYSYHASKAGLVHLTRRLAAQLAPQHINVTAIAPGAFASEMNRSARDHAGDVSKFIPAGRVGCAEDMAAAAIYLAARSGDYVVGSTLTVDGGVVDGQPVSKLDI